MPDFVEVLKDTVGSFLQERAFQKRLGRFLTHPVTLLAIATIFATLAGAWLTNYYQERAWVREKQFETFRYTFDEGLKVVDELSDAMSKRLFGLNRVVWVAKGTGTGELEPVWNDYYASVVDWNVKLMRYKGRLSRFVNQEAAEAFASAQDVSLSYQEGVPTSLHGQFMVAHQKVRALVDCVRQRCAEPAKQAALKEAQQQLNDLGVAVEQFLETCTERLLPS